ncbi:MAG: DUF2184 domain-containing protein [Gammaproteobacteria bacterium]|nr:DUF2184 domain-containing protein [Gammaproteobacteria bacterium]
MKRYKDIKQLVRDIDSATTASRMNSAMANASEKWSLNGLVNFVEIGPDERSYEYTPESKEMTFADASPMTCRSNPSYTSEGPKPEPIKLFTYDHELALELCFTDCTSDSLVEHLTKKHYQIAMGFGKLDWNMFWYGYAQHGIYGMSNHPNANDQAETAGGTTWAAKTPEEIIQEIIALTQDFESPQIVMSYDSYAAAFGKLVGVNKDKTVMQAITTVLTAMPDVNFKASNIRAVKMLNGLNLSKPNDVHHQFSTVGAVDTSEKDFLIAYDGDAINYRSSSMQALGAGPSENTKYAKAIRWKATQGLVIEKTDSVRIRYGV